MRIDELENSIGELMAQAGIDDEPGAHPRARRRRRSPRRRRAEL